MHNNNSKLHLITKGVICNQNSCDSHLWQRCHLLVAIASFGIAVTMFATKFEIYSAPLQNERNKRNSI